MERGTTLHALFDLARNPLVARVQVLHRLVLGLLGAHLDLLLLFLEVGSIRVERSNLLVFLEFDIFYRGDDVAGRHVLVDRLTVRQRLLLLEGHFHSALRGLLKEVNFFCDSVCCRVIKIRAVIDAKIILEIGQQLIHSCLFPIL